MCRGNEDERHLQSGFTCPDFTKLVLSGHERIDSVLCELCRSRASVYCPADNGFLCKKCDMRVHTANFLALRHIRCFLCETCQKPTQRYLVGASAKLVLRPVLADAESRRQSSSSCSKK